MLIEVICNNQQWDELVQKSTGIDWKKIDNIHQASTLANALCILNVNVDIHNTKLSHPIFINQPLNTLDNLKTSANVYKINAWPGFLQASHWEIMGTENDTIHAIFKVLQKQYSFVQDAIGFVSTRIISMIINEAYFALAENVSTKGEIDIAMKLGTNYPYGPFEWADKIGIQNVYWLLDCLSKTDKRYTPAPLLQKAALQ
jgi:3-hydroxybutyryl-CoA dehydrogenase